LYSLVTHLLWSVNAVALTREQPSVDRGRGMETTFPLSDITWPATASQPTTPIPAVRPVAAPCYRMNIGFTKLKESMLVTSKTTKWIPELEYKKLQIEEPFDWNRVWITETGHCMMGNLKNNNKK
jgi:hypothetical protein